MKGIIRHRKQNIGYVWLTLKKTKLKKRDKSYQNWRGWGLREGIDCRWWWEDFVLWLKFSEYCGSYSICQNSWTLKRISFTVCKLYVGK